MSDVPRVVCACGSAEIELLSTRPCACVQCCCCDCYHAFIWGESKGGPESPAVVDASYWPNDLRVDRGEFVAAKNKAASTGTACSVRIFSKCCYSMLLVDHVAYRRRVFAVNNNRYAGPPLPPPFARIYEQDLTPERRARLPQTEFSSEGGTFASFRGPDPGCEKGETVQALLQRCGPVQFI
eukprot:gnl/TRDRNA2_/TRDRNA2_60514_c0_seq1.p2 gnl/TRDRNA2_/TRDRNA2_60514_c0~~gnl/TRDRNA2_/TRDRNA2_60514_c0_seq1.p2  ORF type:complete len:198 (-),score=10.81 gnl/TRDRNA2_/TRDRNA2_60514_c0_seq1:120-665(-)